LTDPFWVRTAVKESKDRVTSAICNNGLRWPYGKRITINLAQADVRKEGSSFDLPIALGMLKLEENNRLPALDAYCISGELALSGQLRPVKGVLSIALEAKRRQRQTLIVPLENAAEAAVVEGVDVYGVCSLSQVVHFLRGDITLDRCAPPTAGPSLDPLNRTLISARSKASSMSNARSKLLPLGDIIYSPLDLFRPEQLSSFDFGPPKAFRQKLLDGPHFEH
jgi:predicted ATPase with chaperone activity